MELLDNENVIAQRDPNGALKTVSEAYVQLTWEPEVERLNGPYKKPEDIILAGMGGSSLAGLIAKDWLNLEVPFEVVRDYTLPHYANTETLVIIVSVSGNTEETVASLENALARKCKVICVSTGGKIEEIAKSKQLPFIKLPKYDQPRYGIFAHLRAITYILNQFSFGNKHFEDLASVAKNVETATRSFQPDISTPNNQAKLLALHCIGKTPVIFASHKFASVAYKWKISFNENARNVAYYNEQSEFCHNEFMGWTSHPIDKPFAILDLRSRFDNPRIKKRFDVCDRLLSGMRPKAIEVKIAGDTILEQYINGAILGDFTTIYVGILNGVNPGTSEFVEKLKAEL